MIPAFLRSRFTAYVTLGAVVAILMVAAGCATADPLVDETTSDPLDEQVPIPDTNDAKPQPDDEELTVVTVPRDVKAAWVHLFDDTLKTSASIQAMVDEADKAGVNLLIVQVARRHDAYYTSDVLPRTTDDTLEPDLDVLNEVLTAAHARGIAVHAWYGIAPTWHAVYDTLDAPQDPWIALTRGITAPADQRWVSQTAEGSWTEYLDVGVPEVRQHVVAVVDEILTRYPVDGIHLDYVRYGGGNTGYNPAALAAFAADTGVTTRPQPDDDTFVAWRKAAVTQLVRDVHQRTAGHGVVLSAAVITWGSPPVDGNLAATRTGRDALQPWDSWLHDGILDVAFPMNYFRAARAEHAGWFAGWLAYQEQLDRAVDGHVVSGVGGYLNSVTDTLTQLEAAIQSTGSFALYSWQQPTDGSTRQLRDELATRYGDKP